MSNRPSAGAARTASGIESTLQTVADAGAAVGRERTVRAVGIVAVVAVAVERLLQLAHNLPFDPVTVPAALRASVDVLTPLAVALALVAIALATRRATVRVGGLFAGVFGALALASPAATLPAVVALVAGGALALPGTLGRPTNYRSLRRLVVAVAFVAGVAVSLSSAIGLVGGGLRGAGTALALVAIIGSGVRAEGDRLALLGGALAFVGTFAASAVSPYVAGSVLLVGFGVVGVPLVLPALAAGAAVAVATTGLRRGAVAPVAGAGLITLAGVPATVPRAMAVVLGAVLVLVDVGTLVDAEPSGAREVRG